MDTLLYAGSFDPVTRGHMDVIRRAAALKSRTPASFSKYAVCRVYQ